MKYVVELNDSDGVIFQMELILPWLEFTADTGNSTWRAIDSGFIKYHRGGCKAIKEHGFAPIDIYVLSGGYKGIKFLGFFDSLGLVNSSGTGKIQPSWTVNFNYGSFGWTLIS